MKKHLLSTIFLLSIFIIIGGSGCKKSTTDTSLPTLTTQNVMLDVT